MDRGALIGGAAVVAALGAVLVFYFVLSSGSTEEVTAYNRTKPEVEQLKTKPAGVALIKKDDGTKSMGAAQIDPALTTAEPIKNTQKAKNWVEKRAEAAVRDRRMTEKQLSIFLKDKQFDAPKQDVLRGLFTDNFDLRNSIRAEIEEGTTSPRVGRKRLAKQREDMKTSLLEHLSDEEYDEILGRMNRIRVLLF